MPRRPDSPRTPRPQEIRAAAQRAAIPGIVAYLTTANGVPPTTAEITLRANAIRPPGTPAVQRAWVDRQIWRLVADGILTRTPGAARTIRVVTVAPPATDPPTRQGEPAMQPAAALIRSVDEKANAATGPESHVSHCDVTSGPVKWSDPTPGPEGATIVHRPLEGG